MPETLYGRQAVREALRAGRRRFKRLLLSDSVQPSPILDDIVALASSSNVTVDRVPRHWLTGLGDVGHQGVALETSEYPYAEVDEIVSAAQERGEPPFLLVLDLIGDPQNLGTLFRTCEAVGVHGVMIQERRAAGITPAVVRASSGAVEHLLVARVTNLARGLTGLKDRDVWVAGLDNTDYAAVRYDWADLKGGLALVVGSEGRGLRRLVRERCDFLVELPMMGQIGSLNAAVAGSIVLYEAWRQRSEGRAT